MRNTLERCSTCGRWVRAITPTKSWLSAEFEHDCPRTGLRGIGVVKVSEREPPPRGRPLSRVKRERKLDARIEIWPSQRGDRRQRLRMMLLGVETRAPPSGHVVWRGKVRDQDEADRILWQRTIAPGLRTQRSRLRKRIDRRLIP
jgi:hypothetical protein